MAQMTCSPFDRFHRTPKICLLLAQSLEHQLGGNPPSSAKLLIRASDGGMQQLSITGVQKILRIIEATKQLIHHGGAFLAR